jgi:hypothetical protein
MFLHASPQEEFNDYFLRSLEVDLRIEFAEQLESVSSFLPHWHRPDQLIGISS